MTKRKRKSFSDNVWFWCDNKADPGICERLFSVLDLSGAFHNLHPHHMYIYTPFACINIFGKLGDSLNMKTLSLINPIIYSGVLYQLGQLLLASKIWNFKFEVDLYLTKTKSYIYILMCRLWLDILPTIYYLCYQWK